MVVTFFTTSQPHRIIAARKTWMALYIRDLIRIIPNTVKHVKFSAVAFSERGRSTTTTVVGDAGDDLICLAKTVMLSVLSHACAWEQLICRTIAMAG